MTARSNDAPAAVRPLTPSQPVEDAALVQRARDGDAWARDMLYRRYASLVIGIATRLLGNATEAEDVAQDAFVSAFEDLSKLRDPAALRSWLTGITIHRVHKRFRRRSLRRRLGFDGAATDLTALIARPVPPDVRASIADLARVLERLPAAQRTCWWLRYGEGYALQEVADAHRCSLTTAKRRIAAAHAVVSATLSIEVPA